MKKSKYLSTKEKESDKMTNRAIDPYVLNVQKWVNNTYSGKTGYTVIEETGQIG